MLELFILKRKIKGPCWLSLTNVKKVPSEHRSTWCRQELVVDNPKDVTCKAEELNKAPPPLTSVTLHAQMVRNTQNTNEIAMISFLVQNKVSIDSQTTDDKGITNFTLMRKLDTMPFPPDL